MSTSTDSAVMEHKVLISSVPTRQTRRPAHGQYLLSQVQVQCAAASFSIEAYIYKLKGCAMILSVPVGERMTEYKASRFTPLGKTEGRRSRFIQEIPCIHPDLQPSLSTEFNLRIKDMRRDDEYSCPAQGIGQKALGSEHLELIAVGASLLLGTIPSPKLEPATPSRLNICLVKICAAMHDVLLVLSALTEVVYGGEIQTRRHINRNP